MITVPGYQVIEKLYESSRSLIYRALRSSDQTSVILKVLRQEYPSPAAIARLQTEYDLLCSLSIAGVVKADGLEIHQQTVALVLEDFDGISLQAWLRDRKLSVEASIKLIMQVTATLAEIHQHNIMHKDINPSNIMLIPATGQVKIIDFGIATDLSQEIPILSTPSVLEGTLAYMSPEQTGRMNRIVDYRTDFYSLGVTFYQLLCDRLPFETEDALELVYCHIARQPLSPHDVKPSIPRPVSDIVMKLLAKTAEDRYQSARGIQADLQECLTQLQQTQHIEPFNLGRWDISSQLQIPQKLYGREPELAALLTAFEQVVGAAHRAVSEWENESKASSSLSHPPLILVSGLPGSGKTTLVRELYKPITHQQNYFITGKYDQLQQQIPYAALIQAFQGLICQLLTEAEEQIDRWRSRLLETLGDNAQVVIDVIPEVELLIGKQPDVIDLSPAEAQNRFHLVFESFIRVFTESTGINVHGQIHSLIIFLDDLQWADSASLQLIHRLMTGLDHPHLLLIGAYRDHEINAAHPLIQTLEDIKQTGGMVNHIALRPLGLGDVNQLVQETLKCEADRSLPLAELVMQKTTGNPFFINEFLRFLHQERLLQFDAQQGMWQWDLNQIQAAQPTDNLIELVLDRIQELPVQSQTVVTLAACIGNQFDLHTLTIVTQRSPREIAADLQAAVRQNLITPVGDYSGSWLLAPGSYKFLHDRIQAAAYSLISESNRLKYHLSIGTKLLESTPKEQLEDRIFTVVNHLNIGSTLLIEQSQRDKLAQLNLMAGKKAKATVAYESAFQYLKLGRSLLSENSWDSTYKLTLALCESTAEAAYLTGDFEQMEQRIEEVLTHTKTALERTKVHLIQIQAYIAQNRFMDAIRTSLHFLGQLGIQLPIQPSQSEVMQGLAETKRALSNVQLEQLVDLPQMTDPESLAAMQMIASVCTPTYFLVPDLWQLMVFQKVQLSLKYGNAPGSAFGYADYGMIQCSVDDNIDSAYLFSQIAATLQNQLKAKEFIPKTSLLVNMYLKHWREHLKETLNPLLQSYQAGLETGDLEYATFAIVYRFYHSYLIGKELNQLEQEIGSYESAIAQFKQDIPLKLTQIYRQVALNLTDSSQSPYCLVGASFNEDQVLPQLHALSDKYTLFHLHLNKLILCYLFQETAAAAKQADITAHLLAEGAAGMLVVPVFYFYDSLARIAIFPEASQSEQQQILQKVADNQVRMKHWADHAPMNYLHKFHLVEAERCRILGQDAEASDAYDRAISLASEHEYLNEEALAAELAGRFYLAKGKPKFAQTYLLDARYSYLRWGATAKVNDLDRRYPEFFDRLPEKTLMVSKNQISASSSTVTESLDLAALMKASQALSDEIVLDKLLSKLMTILIENSGAEQGCLLLAVQNKLHIVAEGNAELAVTSVSPVIPIDSEAARTRVAVAIVNYAARTQDTLVINHAAQDYRFGQDFYIQSHQPKSVLCIPLIHQGTLSGILYLENRLTTSVFTPNRLQVLQFLSTQAAISIENAQLYNQLELRVEQRTLELTQTNQLLQAEILERQRSEQTLRLIVEGTASVIGEDFFRSLVRSLAQALDVRYAFISECVDHPVTRVRSFVFWQGNEFGDAFEYDLYGTPCERIINSKGCQCFPEDIQALFPEDKDLEEIQAQSYAGIALLNSTGQLLGHLAVLDNKPMVDESRNQAVLEIFAARAAAEMERRQAEEALRVSETKFSTAFRSSPDAITISTLNDGCYVEINDSCLSMLGYLREEMLGQSAIDLEIWARAEDRDAVKQMLQQQGKVSNLEVKFRKKSGEVFPALYSAEVIHLEDEPCLLSVAADITMLKQAEKALERLAEIGELAAMIVHEVRNPLTTISMGLNSFRKLQLSERFQEYLSLSLDEAERLQRLLNQILLYSRPQTLQRSPLELNHFITETLNALQTIPAASGKELRFFSKSVPIQVMADSDKLKQVLINLVTNACEAVNEGGNITVRLEKTENNQVSMQVHNEGSPIPADILPKLTKPFFTTKPSGTGLGLAIVKRIVEAHDGEFSIESSEISGTTVAVKIPLMN